MITTHFVDLENEDARACYVVYLVLGYERLKESATFGIETSFLLTASRQRGTAVHHSQLAINSNSINYQLIQELSWTSRSAWPRGLTRIQVILEQVRPHLVRYLLCSTKFYACLLILCYICPLLYLSYIN